MTKFQELLNEAMGDNSQSDFASKTMIAKAQLNRYVKGKGGYPTPDILKRIAKASDGRVTFEKLMRACNHDMADYKEKEANRPDDVIAKEEISNILSLMDRLRGLKTDSLTTIKEIVNNGICWLSEEYECNEDIDINAENYIFFTIDRILDNIKAQYVFIVTFNKTVKGDYIVSKCFSDGKTLLKSPYFENVIQMGLDELDKEQIKILNKFYVSTRLDNDNTFIKKERIKRGENPISRDEAIVFCKEKAHIHKLGAESFLKEQGVDIIENEMDRLKYNNRIELSNIYADIANLLDNK